MTNDAELLRLLQDSARAGVHALPAAGAAEVAKAAHALDFAVFRIELQGCGDKAALLQRIAAAMRFPDWFGHNWDALSDCLTDLSWEPARGYVVILEHADALRGESGDTLATALDVFEDASREWADESVPMWVFVSPAADASARARP